MQIASNADWKSFRLGCKLREHCHMQGPWLTLVPAVPGTATRLGRRGIEGLSEHPEDEGGWVSSLLVPAGHRGD